MHFPAFKAAAACNLDGSRTLTATVATTYAAMPRLHTTTPPAPYDCPPRRATALCKTLPSHHRAPRAHYTAAPHYHLCSHSAAASSLSGAKRLLILCLPASCSLTAACLRVRRLLLATTYASPVVRRISRLSTRTRRLLYLTTTGMGRLSHRAPPVYCPLTSQRITSRTARRARSPRTRAAPRISARINLSRSSTEDINSFCVY